MKCHSRFQLAKQNSGHANALHGVQNTDNTRCNSEMGKGGFSKLQLAAKAPAPTVAAIYIALNNYNIM